MLPEETFKIKLIDKLNFLNAGWIDGDKVCQSGKTADIINKHLKIAIEIKDDLLFKIPNLKSGEMALGTVNLVQKNRQFRQDAKDANKKFTNYFGYKTLLIIRTEFPSPELGMAGPEYFTADSGLSCWPSTFFGQHDNSTKEIGGFLFINHRLIYIENKNLNVNTGRIMLKEEIQNMLGFEV